MKKNAFALRRHNVGDQRTEAGAVVLGMAPEVFDSFVEAGLVREATDAEVKRERDKDAPAPAPAPAKPASPAKR
jgi:hypothetical protein